MKNIVSTLFVATAAQSVALAAPAGQDEPMSKRLENGLGRTPALGYNNWVRPCIASSIISVGLLTRSSEQRRLHTRHRGCSSQGRGPHDLPWPQGCRLPILKH
jgi:hypothetical protein